jgi:putative oxidoreductase
MRYVPLVGRALFAAIFLNAVPGHFQDQTISFVSEQGIPLAGLFVPLAGLLALAGGVSVLLGWRARHGAWLLVAYLVPVTFLMHPFWVVSDPGAAAVQEAMFFRNVSMLGGALLITGFGAGPLSMDARETVAPFQEIRKAA